MTAEKRRAGVGYIFPTIRAEYTDRGAAAVNSASE